MKFDFFFNLFVYEIFYNEESLVVCFIQVPGVVFRGVLERQLRKLFDHKEIGYVSKNIKAAVKYLVKYHAKNLVKVTRTGEVMGRKRTQT